MTKTLYTPLVLLCSCLAYLRRPAVLKKNKHVTGGGIEPHFLENTKQKKHPLYTPVFFSSALLVALVALGSQYH